MLEIITDWQFENGNGGLSVMYFEDSSDVAITRAAIDTLFTDFAARLDSLTTWTVRTSGKEIDPSTGTLTGFWNEPTPATGAGSLTGQPVSNATNVLLRWRTPDIVRGRLVQGRTYVPGLSVSSMDGGQLSSATLTDIQDAQAAFLSTGSVDFVIWSRPSDAGPGSIHFVSTGATWNELSVQRRRR